MRNIMHCVAGMVAGAIAMYYLDPETGRRRRAMVRDKAVGGRHDVERYARKGMKQTSDQLRGVAAKARATAGLAPQAQTDEQLAERVRSQMGRLVSRPGAIDVAVTNGRVSVGGHILAKERESFLSALADMAGVEQVDDQLQVHEQAGNIPELQGNNKGAQ